MRGFNSTQFNAVIKHFIYAVALFGHGEEERLRAESVRFIRFG